jgi:hypothetical protein
MMINVAIFTNRDWKGLGDILNAEDNDSNGQSLTTEANLHLCESPKIKARRPYNHVERN